MDKREMLPDRAIRDRHAVLVLTCCKGEKANMIDDITLNGKRLTSGMEEENS